MGGPRPPPRRLLPPAIPISQPVRSSKFRATTCPSTNHLHSKHDLIVWFEILELGRFGFKSGVVLILLSFQLLLVNMYQFWWIIVMSSHVVDSSSFIMDYREEFA